MARLLKKLLTPALEQVKNQGHKKRQATETQVS